MTAPHATGRIRLHRDAEQWEFDRAIKDTGRVFHFQPEGRGALPRAVRNHRMIVDVANRLLCVHGPQVSMDAIASEAGVARAQCSESTACDSASIPVAAVSERGIDSVRSGSTRATRGQIRGSNRFIFLRRSVSVMMAEGETSLPVPAVVGTASTGSGAAWSVPKSSQSRGWPPLVMSRAMHLAVSIADPPPSTRACSYRVALVSGWLEPL